MLFIIRDTGYGPTRSLGLAIKVFHPLPSARARKTFNHIQSVVSESHLLKLNLSAAFCPIVPRWHQAGITEQKLFVFTSLEPLYPFGPRPVRMWSNRTSWLTVSCFLRKYDIYDIMAIFKRDSISLETSAILWDYTRKTKTTLFAIRKSNSCHACKQKSAHHRRCIHPPTRGFESLERGQHSLPQWSTYSSSKTDKIMRKELVDMGQAPHTAIIGCADSRAPLETIFDAMPGDLFVLRNAGNTCTHAEGSMVGSLEFCTGKLGARMILVLGHTNCGAVYGATNAYLAAKKSGTASVESALEGLLLDLAPVAEKAVAEMPHQNADDIAAYAVRVNVFHTIDFLLKYSAGLREKVKSGQVEIQGGIYHLESGKVEFMGCSPQQSALLSTNLGLPPSMTREGWPHFWLWPCNPR